MKRLMLLVVAICFLLTGCSKAEQGAGIDIKEPESAETVKSEATQSASDAEEQKEPAAVVYPLPDTTMEI